MNPQDVVQDMLAPLATRPECLHLAVDRGLGEGMKVEWSGVRDFLRWRKRNHCH